MKNRFTRILGKRGAACAVAFFVMCVSLFSGCSKQEDTTEKTESIPVSEEAESTQAESAQEANSQKEEITEQQLRDAETKWQEQKEQHDVLEQELQEFLALSKDVSGEKLQLMLEKTIVEAYKENAAIALEIKALIAENLDVNAPDKFKTYLEETEDMGAGMMQDAAIDYALSYVGNDSIKELLKDGIKGGMEEYTDSGSIKSALEGAQKSVSDGIECQIADAPLETAGAVLDATSEGLGNLATGLEGAESVDDYVTSVGDSYTNGLISSLTGMKDKLSKYDETPGALLNTLSRAVNTQAGAIKEFLEKEMVTSGDLSAAVSVYMQFGSMLECMADYGIGVNCDWQGNCKSAQALYGKYVSNENLISQLSADNGANILPENYTLDIADIPNSSFEALENRDKADVESYYHQIEEEISTLEDENAQLQEISQKKDAILSPLQEYRNQVEQIAKESAGLLEYEEAQIEFSVDTNGIEKMKEVNKINAGIGEVVGVVPGVGSALKFFFSGAVSNSDRYYEKLVKTSTQFAKAHADAAEQARVDIMEFKKQYAFYEELTQEGTLEENLQNLMVLDYILARGKIDLADYREKAYKSLYVWGCGYDLTYQFYEVLNPDNAGGFLDMYNEIKSVLENDGMTEVMDNVTAEDLKGALIPIIKAGNEGLYELQDISVPILDVIGKKVKVNINGGVFGGAWLRLWDKAGTRMHASIDAMDVYFAGGSAVCINGLYIYNGIPLNGSADMDTVLSETQWLYSMDDNREDIAEFSDHYHALIAAVQSVEPVESPDAPDAEGSVEPIESPDAPEAEGSGDLAETPDVSDAEGGLELTDFPDAGEGVS